MVTSLTGVLTFLSTNKLVSAKRKKKEKQKKRRKERKRKEQKEKKDGRRWSYEHRLVSISGAF